MIFANIKNLNDYAYLDEKIKKCFTYYRSNDLNSFNPGSYEIEGKDIFVNIVEYETKEDSFWEAHKDYIDLHLMLDGEEKIKLNFIENMKLGSYSKEEDYQALEGDSNSSVILKKEDFLICYPSDGHMTGLRLKDRTRIKKAIFKIKL